MKSSATVSRKDQDIAMTDDGDEDEEDAPVTRRPAARARRAVFDDSDSE